MCGLVVYVGSDQRKKDLVNKAVNEIKYRGPDNTTIKLTKKAIFGFNRLAIMDLSSEGNQPFQKDENTLVCNGEIYNYEALKDNNYKYQSDSDCEVLLSLYDTDNNLDSYLNKLDAEFAMVMETKKGVFAARDPMGIRPLFYGKDEDGEMWFASEAKSLLNICSLIEAFPPGAYWINGKFYYYTKLYEYNTENYIKEEPVALEKIKSLLEEGVYKRLNSDAPLGFLLSGGLDSSLVCAIAQKVLKKPIKTFAIGINKNPIDTKYAKIVADHIGSDHTEVLFSEEDIKNTLKELIYRIESWDITTIRASMGMYLICKYIKENTSIKVLLTGEVSDELFGYKYTDFAPSPAAFQEEASKRIKELYLYDVLRADRCISSHSLEARVPFSDKYFVEAVMQIDPELKINHSGTGKYLLRKAFKDTGYLTDEILYRDKAAFSDAVGHRSVDYLKELAEAQYTDNDFLTIQKKYKENPPQTKEALYYREIYNELFPNQGHLIPSYWLPNQEWENCNVVDPSARALPNYGKSGD